MIYGGWQALARVIIVGVPAYLALLLSLRMSGKRKLLKLNAFDVVTIVLGSTPARGKANLDDVAMVVETDGNLSMLTREPGQVEPQEGPPEQSGGATRR